MCQPSLEKEGSRVARSPLDIVQYFLQMQTIIILVYMLAYYTISRYFTFSIKREKQVKTIKQLIKVFKLQ